MHWLIVIIQIIVILIILYILFQTIYLICRRYSQKSVNSTMYMNNVQKRNAPKIQNQFYYN